MGFFLSLLVNAAAAYLSVLIVARVMRRRPNVDGRAASVLLLFAVFGVLYLVTSALMRLDAAAEVCR